MDWVDGTVTALKRNDVGVVSYLPDTVTSPLIDRFEADDAFTTIEVTREEQAVGVLSGAWLAGDRGVLLCQSSGLATTINALSSLSKPARIPFLGLVTRRGDLGEFNLSQVPFGYAMPDVLDDIGIRNNAIDEESDVELTVDFAAKTAFSTEEPYILQLNATLFGPKDEF